MNMYHITLHPQFTIASVDPRLFGGFLEHLGRAVYEGVFQPESIHADENGFRTDVLKALKALRLTTMRYPGGNFASGYHWRDGVGPKDRRPVITDPVWDSLETNQFGTDEFLRLCALMDWQPMLACNLGTGTPEEARDWVDYCNKTGRINPSVASAQTGGVKYWCLGNEMDGPWQLGHAPAGEYALRASQAASLMKEVDPSIELTACGSCTIDLPTYLEWDREVLECLGDQIDTISLHRYAVNKDGNLPEYLASTIGIDRQIEEMDAVCRFVQARRRSSKRIYLSFDEWNVWYRTTGPEFSTGHGKFAPHLVEEEFDLADALVVAGFINSFIRHADCVKMASLAQVVNAIAPLVTRGDDLLMQTTYYPLLMVANRRDGLSLRQSISGPGYTSRVYGEVSGIDTSAVLGEDRLHVFAVNRSPEKPASVAVDMEGMIKCVNSAEIISGENASSKNTFDDPMNIFARPFHAIRAKKGAAEMDIPPLSFVAVSFDLL